MPPDGKPPLPDGELPAPLPVVIVTPEIPLKPDLAAAEFPEIRITEPLPAEEISILGPLIDTIILPVNISPLDLSLT